MAVEESDITSNRTFFLMSRASVLGCADRARAKIDQRGLPGHNLVGELAAREDGEGGGISQGKAVADEFLGVGTGKGARIGAKPFVELRAADMARLGDAIEFGMDVGEAGFLQGGAQVGQIPIDEGIGRIRPHPLFRRRHPLAQSRLARPV